MQECWKWKFEKVSTCSYYASSDVDMLGQLGTYWNDRIMSPSHVKPQKFQISKYLGSFDIPRTKQKKDSFSTTSKIWFYDFIRNYTIFYKQISMLTLLDIVSNEYQMMWKDFHIIFYTSFISSFYFIRMENWFWGFIFLVTFVDDVIKRRLSRTLLCFSSDFIWILLLIHILNYHVFLTFLTLIIWT